MATAKNTTPKKSVTKTDAVEVEVETTEVPEPIKAPKSAPYVVGRDSKDSVHLTALKRNLNATKSLSVHHLQRRLRDWGFSEAYADRDGFYGELTEKSVRDFQEYVGLEPTGIMDAATATRLFDNDQNVVVVF